MSPLLEIVRFLHIKAHGDRPGDTTRDITGDTESASFVQLSHQRTENHMNCYQTIDSAARAVIRRHPTWIDTILPDDPAVTRATADAFLHTLARTIATDSPCSNASDALVRHLIGIGRTDPDAITLLLAATARRTRSKIGANATVDYHADVLGTLAMAFLDAPLAQNLLARRTINRAHNTVYRERTSHRHRGRNQQLTVDPAGPELIIRLHQLHHVHEDIADNAVRAADLMRFRRLVEDAVDHGQLPKYTWVHYRDFHLRHVFVPDEYRRGTDRVRAYRAALDLQHLAVRHLSVHAA